MKLKTQVVVIEIALTSSSWSMAIPAWAFKDLDRQWVHIFK